MDLHELITKRRSVMVDQYIDKDICKEDILKILEAGNWAPTHKRTEPWRFKVITGNNKNLLGSFLADKYKQVTPDFSEFKCSKIKDNPQKAAVIIAICMQKDPKISVPEWEEIAAVAMAVQNMWLTATELNIGAYWSSPPLIKYADEFFDLNEGEVCLGFFYMGYFHTNSPDRVPGSIENKVTWM